MGQGLARGCSHQEDVITGHTLLQDLLTHHLQQAVGHQHLEVSARLPGQQNLHGQASLGLCPVAQALRWRVTHQPRAQGQTFLDLSADLLIHSFIHSLRQVLTATSGILGIVLATRESEIKPSGNSLD